MSKVDAKNANSWPETASCLMLWTAFKEVRTWSGKNFHRWRNMDQLVNTRDKGSVNDVENPRIAISQEIQNDPIRRETDVRCIFRRQWGDSGPYSSPRTDNWCCILYEGKLE